MSESVFRHTIYEAPHHDFAKRWFWSHSYSIIHDIRSLTASGMLSVPNMWLEICILYLVLPMFSDYLSPTPVLGILVWLPRNQTTLLSWLTNWPPSHSWIWIASCLLDVTAYAQSDQIFSKDRAPRWRVPRKKNSLATSLPIEKNMWNNKST